MSTPAALLRLEGIGKRFGRVTVASDVSMTVPAEQALGIVNRGVSRGAVGQTSSLSTAEETAQAPRLAS